MTRPHAQTLLGACLVAGLLSTNTQAAPLQNGDFTPDFAPWQGEVENADFDVIAVDPDASPRFTLVGAGRARIETAPAIDPADNLFAVQLFQTFDLPHWARTIAFDYAWAMTDPTGDYVDAVLIDTVDTLLFADLFADVDTEVASASGRAFGDVAALAGRRVQIGFRVEDGGDDLADWLQIGHIEVVPLPGTLALLGLGLLALPRLRRHRD